MPFFHQKSLLFRIFLITVFFNNHVHCVFLQALKEKELGNTAYKNRKFDAALKHYEEAIRHDPTNMSYISNKAGKRTAIHVKPMASSQVIIPYSAFAFSRVL